MQSLKYLLLIPCSLMLYNIALDIRFYVILTFLICVWSILLVAFRFRLARFLLFRLYFVGCFKLCCFR